MNMIKEFTLGFSTLFKAHKIIKKHKMGFYVAIPGFINLVLFVLVLILAGKSAGSIAEFLGDKFDPSRWTTTFTWFLNIILFLAVVVIYFLFYKYLVLILMSPVLALVSEKTEEIITGQKAPGFNPIQLLKDSVRGIKLAVKNMLIEIGISIGLFIFSFIPFVGLVVPLAGFVVQGYFVGFSMMDYVCERRKWNVKKSSRFVFKHKEFACANGMLFILILMVPVIGILVAPAYTAVAATAGTLEIMSHSGEDIKKSQIS